MTYRSALGKPSLIFTMQLDSVDTIIPGVNRGRIVLIDDAGVIGRWMFTTSFDGKQRVNDWNKTGGVIPPTTSMPDSRAWEFHTQRLIRPGMAVDDGYLITFKGDTRYRTKEGGERSELMIHDDKNRATAKGSYGCPVAWDTSEWFDFNKAMLESVSHLPTLPLIVIYTW